MKPFSCAAARRRLHAFHDEELPVEEQIAMSSHLEWCDSCAEALDELQFVSSVVRSTGRERFDFTDELAFQQAVIGRMAAEERVSWRANVRDMFEDMRLVYAGLSATVAAVACVLMMFNVMRSVVENRNPNSLAGIVKTMVIAENQMLHASFQGEAAIQRVMDARLLPPNSTGATYAADSDAEVVLADVDAEYAFRGVVTREGRVDALELFHLSTGLPVAAGTDEAKALRKMMGVIARGRYQPASVDGLPVAMTKVWPVAHTTVHATKTSLEPPPPLSSRKRLTIFSGLQGLLPA